MTTLFFGFRKAEGRRRPRWIGLAAGLALVGAFLLPGVPGARAGLLPSAKDRSQGEALFQQASTAYQGGDYAGSLHLLEQADALEPDQADAWNLRGVVLLKQKAYDKAEAAFARSVKIDPGLWAAQFNLAEVSFQKKNFARARSVFESLLAQTDRYKAGSKWELVLYKAFLCALLSGDEADARKKLAKLPATGGATPAFQYAQAALAFSHKDAAGANRILAGAQTAYTPALNGLFSPSLETAGWQTPAVNLLPGTQVASADPATAAAMNAAGLTNPGGNLALPGGSSPAARQRPAVVIDPRLVAAASDPLPSAPGRDVIPVAGQPTPSPAGKNAGAMARHPAKENPAASPAAGTKSAGGPEPAATPASPFDHEGLLLGTD